MRFVQPARLGDAQAVDFFAARQDGLQGNLGGEGKLVLQVVIARHAPEQQAPRARQQMQLFAQVRLLDRSPAAWRRGET